MNRIEQVRKELKSLYRGYKWDEFTELQMYELMCDTLSRNLGCSNHTYQLLADYVYIIKLHRDRIADAVLEGRAVDPESVAIVKEKMEGIRQIANALLLTV